MKLQFWGPATLLKKTTTLVLSCWIRQIFKKTISKKICELLHLNLFKKKIQHRCFPMNFVNFSRAPILKSTYEQLVLKDRSGGFSLIKLQT